MFDTCTIILERELSKMKKKKLFTLSIILSLILCSGCQSPLTQPNKSEEKKEETSTFPQFDFSDPSIFGKSSEESGDESIEPQKNSAPTRLAIKKGYIYNNVGAVNEEFAEKGDMLEYIFSGDSSEAVVLVDNTCYYIAPTLEARQISDQFVINARINYDGGYIYYLANNYSEQCTELYCYATASGESSLIWKRAGISYMVSPDGRTVAFVSEDAEGLMIVIESQDRPRELYNIMGRPEIISVSNDGLVYFCEDLRTQAIYKIYKEEMSVIWNDSTIFYSVNRNCHELLFQTSMVDGLYYFTPDMEKPYCITEKKVYDSEINLGGAITYAEPRRLGTRICNIDSFVGIMYDSEGGRLWFTGPQYENYVFPDGVWNFGVVKSGSKSYAIRYLRSEKEIYLDTMENGKIESQTICKGLSTRGLPHICSDGSVWVSTSDGDLYLWKNGNLDKKASDIVQGNSSVSKYVPEEDLLYVAIDGFLCSVDRKGTVTQLTDNCAEMYASMEYDEFPCFSDKEGKHYAYIYGMCPEIKY